MRGEGWLKLLRKLLSGASMWAMRHDVRDTGESKKQGDKMLDKFGPHAHELYTLCKKMTSLVFQHSPNIDSGVAYTAAVIWRLAVKLGLMSTVNITAFLNWGATPKNSSGKNLYAKFKDCKCKFIMIANEESRCPTYSGWGALGPGPLLDEDHDMRKALSITTRNKKQPLETTFHCLSIIFNLYSIHLGTGY
jgi:hypothetical protein